MNFVKATLAVLCFAAAINLSAQEDDHVNKCAMDEIMAKMRAEDPSFEAAFKARIDYMDSISRIRDDKKSSAAVYQIPIVFHVIYNSEYDNISKAQLLDGLRVLNEDFRRLNADASLTRNQFKAVAADTEIEFVLATKDPNGNCTDGITRTQDFRSIEAYDNVKNIIRWPANRYINVWIVNSISETFLTDNVLGYGHFPYNNYDPNLDGVVIRHDAVGSIGTAANADRVGRTLPHEMGHNLGLYHPFGRVAGSYSCSYSDGVADTPPVLGPSYGCDLNRNTCGNLNQIENFMDYADDPCVNMFTTGQRNIMRDNLDNNANRSFLNSTGNLALTGVSNPVTCAPTASISIESPIICPTGNVEFGEVSNGSAATSWRWSFPGGQPVTSNSPNPVVVYPNAGNYPVSLVVTNSAGSDSSFFPAFVRVRPLYTGHNASYNESFEGNLESTGIYVNTPEDNNTFKITGAAASEGSQSLKLDNFSSGAYAAMSTVKGGGARDEVILPPVYPTFAKNLVMTFEYAFAAREASSNYDALRVYASEDCGQTWNFIRIFQSGLIRTAPDQNNSAFTPSAGQWRTGLIPLSSYDGRGAILVKIEFENGGGNNLFLDDIQITSDNVSITEYELAKNISVFPNPSNGVVNVEFNSETQSEVKLAVYDLYGRMVSSETLPSGTTKYEIGAKDKLATGIYLLQVEEAGMTYAERLVVK